MEIIVILSVICFVFFLGLLVVVFLQNKLNVSLMKDVLGLRVDLQALQKKIDLSIEGSSELKAKFSKEFEELGKSVDDVLEHASEANSATQTILKEYELNGTPLGYIRNEHGNGGIDAYEGI